MGILCKLGRHAYVERNSVEIENARWVKFNTATRKQTPHSEYHKIVKYVINQCSRKNCDHRVAFEIKYISGGGDDGKIVYKKPIHVDLATEKLFLDKV